MTDSELIEKAATNATALLDLPVINSEHLTVVKIYLILFQIYGGNTDLMKHWVHTYNKHLQCIPLEAISDNRINDVLAYLEEFVFE